MKGFVVFIALLLVGLSAGPSWARGGGGCLREGTPVMTPGGVVAVEQLKEGDVVLGVDGRTLKPVKVEFVAKLQVQAYLEVVTDTADLFITSEHPLMVGPGEFHVAGRIQPGQRLAVVHGNELQEEQVRSVRTVQADRPAYNLLVNPGGTFIPDGVVVHNKGCFLPDSLILKADGTEVPISGIRPGDTLLAFTAEGRVVKTQVRNILQVEADGYIILKTDRTTLRVTPEHPFYVGDGTFKTLEVLRVGDSIISWDGQTLTPQKIVSMEKVSAPIQVFNLQTDVPHTFFVGHIAVHNKGGGCFPAGTRISTPQGDVPIESLAPGDRLIAVTGNGLQVETTVRALLLARNALLKLETEQGFIQASPEHPMGEVDGGFRPMEDLHPGDQVLRRKGGLLVADRVLHVLHDSDKSLVFNLQVDEPHTFLASNFVVHNKGGHSGGSHSSSHYHSGGSGSSSSNLPAWAEWLLAVVFAGVFFGIWVVVIFSFFRGFRRIKKENLDFVYNATAVARKSSRTGKVLEFLGRQDPSVSPQLLAELAESTFRRLQECWEKRDYGPMEPLLMPSLYAQHTAQIRGMIGNHEINRLENLKVERVDLVNVRYTEKPNQREFTALISASARDYYVHDATGKFIRGDKFSAKFQEFWTFQHQDNSWLLREIEQSGESDFLKEENFVEMLTDQNIAGIYGEAAGKEGTAGPWLEKAVEKKATRIDRMLNFLVQTDKLWNRQRMLERAREVFLKVYLVRESGNIGEVPAGDLFPEVAASLRDQLRQWQMDGMKAEYRNICVRKTELIHVGNYDDRARDEYTVRITAHAQRGVRKGGNIISQDAYVTDFEDYWTFGRLDGEWKLKEVLPPSRGKQQLGAENIDQDSSEGQLNWYYRQTRAN